MNDRVKNDYCFGIWQSTVTNLFDIANNVKYVSILSTHTAVEVVFAHDLLDPLGRGPDERRGVQVVQLVEVEEGGEVGEDLVPDPVPEHRHGHPHHPDPGTADYLVCSPDWILLMM